MVLFLKLPFSYNSVIRVTQLPTVAASLASLRQRGEQFSGLGIRGGDLSGPTGKNLNLCAKKSQSNEFVQYGQCLVVSLRSLAVEEAVMKLLTMNLSLVLAPLLQPSMFPRPQLPLPRLILRRLLQHLVDTRPFRRIGTLALVLFIAFDLTAKECTSYF